MVMSCAFGDLVPIFSASSAFMVRSVCASPDRQAYSRLRFWSSSKGSVGSMRPKFRAQLEAGPGLYFEAETATRSGTWPEGTIAS